MPKLSNNQLKILAMLAMVCDHVGAELFPHLVFLRIIGRVAFPIFAYMIAEGCTHTRHPARYLATMAFLGIGCQTVFFIAEGSFYQNILVTFSLSVACCLSLGGFLKEKSAKTAAVLALSLTVTAALTLVLPAVTDGVFTVDYGFAGVCVPVAVYLAVHKPAKLVALTVALAALSLTMPAIQWWSLLAVPLLALYDGSRGKYRLKYLFYVFYPLHLAVIYGIKLLFFR